MEQEENIRARRSPEANKGAIRVKMEPGSLCKLLTIAKECETSTMKIIFSKTGFSLHFKSTDEIGKKNKTDVKQRSVCDSYFDGNDMPRYKYHLWDSEKVPIAMYCISVNPKEFLERIKNLKKNTLSFRLKLNILRDKGNIIVRLSDTGGQTVIGYTNIKNHKQDINLFNKWYSRYTEPTGKIHMTSLSAVIKGSKDCSCEELQFIYNTKTERMKFHSTGIPFDSSESVIQAIPFDNPDSDSSYEADLEDDPMIKRSIFTSCNPWLIKLPAITPIGTLGVYMSSNSKAPLILSLPIGTQGKGYIAIQNPTR